MTILINAKQKATVHLSNEQLSILLNGCILNKRSAQKEFYHVFFGYSMSIALRYSSGYDNAVEITNDAFLKIYNGLKNFTLRLDNIVALFMAWFKKIVINTCIDYLRKHRKRELIITSTDVKQVMLADEDETGEQMLQYQEIIKCIQQLSPVYKTVFNLYVIEGFSHAEIAYQLNISEGASKSNLFKAREHLKQLLKKDNTMRCA